MPREHISADLAQRVREAAGHRCGYCLSPQWLVMARMEIDHILPVAKGGNNEESNLWLACPICNSHKSDKTEAVDPETGELHPLFNPRTQIWKEHFRWSSDGIHIIGLTPVGRATVIALQLSTDPDALQVRSRWVIVGWHPPKD